MDYTTLVAKSKDTQEQPAKGMQSLYAMCQEVVDGRCARGKRYDVAGLLELISEKLTKRSQNHFQTIKRC